MKLGVAFIALVIISAVAGKALRKIYMWLVKNVSKEAADRKRDELLDATRDLDKFPDKYPEYDAEHRYKPVKGVNIVYKKGKKGDVRVVDFALPQKKKPKK